MSRLDFIERNILKNGGLDFFQAATTGNLSTTLAYVNADMFVQSYSGTVTGTPTTSKSSDVPTNGKAVNSLVLTCRRNASPVTLTVSQRIESYDAMEISGEVVSFSLAYKFPVATTIQMVLLTPTAQDNHTSQNTIYTQTITVTADNTWRTAKFEAITLPSLSLGLAVRFNVILPTGTDASNVAHLLSQFKMNKGYKALGFTRSARNIADELRLVKRYYQKSYYHDVAPGTATSAGCISFYQGAGGNADWCTVPFQEEMRTTPTVSFYNPSSGSGPALGQNAGSTNTGNTNVTIVPNGNTSTKAISVSWSIGAAAFVKFHWVADARI